MKEADVESERREHCPFLLHRSFDQAGRQMQILNDESKGVST